MSAHPSEPDQASAPTSRRAPHRVGPALLVVATLGSLAVIAWGVGGSRPATVTTLEPTEMQWASVERGALVESTRVTATVSRGEIISLTAPVSAGRSGAATAATPATTPTTAPTTTPTTTPTTPTTTTIPAASAPAATPTSVAAATATTSPATGGDGTTALTPSTATASTARVVTAISAVGTVLTAGDTAFAVDGHPTIVLPGFVPAWRAIDESTSDGVDVAQLESFLAGAGFDDDGDLKVDGEVDDSTVAAIEAWQESLDLTPTGRIEVGEVVFLAGDVTVVASNASVGTVLDAGETVIDVRTGSPFVDVSTDASWTAVGDEVELSISGSTVTGTVSTFSSGIARVSLPASTTVRDGSEATVRLRRTKVDGELLVPASAILRSDVAGPTVRVRDGRGDDTTTVRIDVLASANGTAAVRPRGEAELSEGDDVARY